MYFSEAIEERQRYQPEADQKPKHDHRIAAAPDTYGKLRAF